jgi:hypothetical protein
LFTLSQRTLNELEIRDIAQEVANWLVWGRSDGMGVRLGLDSSESGVTRDWADLFVVLAAVLQMQESFTPHHVPQYPNDTHPPSFGAKEESGTEIGGEVLLSNESQSRSASGEGSK